MPSPLADVPAALIHTLGIRYPVYLYCLGVLCIAVYLGIHGSMIVVPLAVTDRDALSGYRGMAQGWSRSLQSYIRL